VIVRSTNIDAAGLFSLDSFVASEGYILKYKDEEIARAAMGPSTTQAALAVATGAVYLARSRDQRLCSVHLVYGFLVDGLEETMAATILQLNGCDFFKVKKELLQVGGLDGPFVDDYLPESRSEEIAIIVDGCHDLCQTSRHLSVNTAHLLKTLYQPGLASGTFLWERTPGRQIISDLDRLIQNQDRRHLEG
jgi:hypothetical protein